MASGTSFLEVAAARRLPGGFSSTASVALAPRPPPLREQLSSWKGQPGGLVTLGCCLPTSLHRTASRHGQLRLGAGPGSQPVSTLRPDNAVAMVTDAAT